MSGEIEPQGFVLTAELALADLTRGIDGFTGEPIRNRVVDCLPMAYGILKKKIPVIAGAVCPDWFEKAVVNFTKGLENKVKVMENIK